MSLQLPAPALHTPTWQAGHVSSLLLPRAYPSTLRGHGLQQLCWATRQSQLLSMPQTHFGVLSNPLHGSLCQGKLVPILCFIKKEKCVALSDVPHGSPHFYKITLGICLLWRRPCAGPRPLSTLQRIIQCEALKSLSC